jgi:hypothetical protein
MKVDLSLSNAKIYNIFEVVDIKQGEAFLLTTDSTSPVMFFSNNDPVLSLVEADTTVSGTASGLGTADILIMDQGLTILKKLVINVVAAIVEPATALNITADAAVPK